MRNEWIKNLLWTVAWGLFILLLFTMIPRGFFTRFLMKTKIGGYDQQITGWVVKGQAPVSGMKVKFCSHYDPDCSGNGWEGTTDKDGRFETTQEYSRVLFEMIDVVVQEYKLCVWDGSGWKRIWRISVAPAPRKLRIVCDLDKGPEDTCKAFYNDSQAAIGEIGPR